MSGNSLPVRCVSMDRRSENQHAQNVHGTEDHVQNARVTNRNDDVQNARVTNRNDVQNARTTNLASYSFYYSKEDFERIKKRKGAYLPHWTAENAIYHVSFRLHDSIPAFVSQRLIEEREAMLLVLKQRDRPFTKLEWEQVLYLYTEKIDRYLDAGYGSCWLKMDDIAELVSNALNYFDRERYELLSWCVMPNHVHAVICPFAKISISKNTISKIMHSWKSFTARKANKILNREGKFWMTEYFDRIMRNPEELVWNLEYVYMNPENAGFQNWKWRGRKDLGDLV